MIKAEIIKRIKNLEKKVSEMAIPKYISIYYDWDSEDWVIDEGNGGCVKHFKHYKEYIIHPQYDGIVRIDLLDCPDDYTGQNLFCVSMKEFRTAEMKNKGISFEAVDGMNDGILEQSFKVVLYGE